MNISVNTSAFNKIDDIKTVLSDLKRAGFDSYDFCMYNGSEKMNFLPCEDWEERAKDLRKFADEIGITCNQSHAPFMNWDFDKKDEFKEYFESIERAIKITGILGGKICVVHPCKTGTEEENAIFYSSFLPVAKESNVKVAVENVFIWNSRPNHLRATCSGPEDFAKVMSLLDEEWFVACVDIGHAEIGSLKTSAVELLEAVNSRVHALHVQDTDRILDSHKIPFSMEIDFDKICQTLKKIGYTGDINLEVIVSGVPEGLMFDCMVYMAKTANYIRNLIIN